MIDFVVYQNENVTGVLIFFFCKNLVRCVINSGIEKKVPESGFLGNSYPIMQYDLFPFFLCFNISVMDEESQLGEHIV